MSLLSRLKLGLTCLTGGLVAFTVASASAIATPTGDWTFTVRLDGKPIGMHRFVLADEGSGRLTLSSEAQYAVTLLGVPLYRYSHRARETWAGGCLSSIEARTEDNGARTELLGKAGPDRFELTVRGDDGNFSSSPVPMRCLMSFAYWNPALASQKHLLDPGRGRVEPVSIETSTVLPDDLRMQSPTVRGLRIGGLAQPIDVWYAGERWVGLDAIVGNGRRLSYRLR